MHNSFDALGEDIVDDATKPTAETQSDESGAIDPLGANKPEEKKGCQQRETKPLAVVSSNLHRR